MYFLFLLQYSQVGVYEVLQPDGKERIVRYKANDQTGFLSNVSYVVKGPNGEENRVYQNRYFLTFPALSFFRLIGIFDFSILISYSISFVISRYIPGDLPQPQAPSPSPKYQYVSSTPKPVYGINKGSRYQSPKKNHESRVTNAYGPPTKYNPTNENEQFPLGSQNYQRPPAQISKSPTIQNSYKEPIYPLITSNHGYASNSDKGPPVYSPPESIQNNYEVPDYEGSGSDLSYESNNGLTPPKYSPTKSNYAVPQRVSTYSPPISDYVVPNQYSSSNHFVSSTIAPPLQNSQVTSGASISSNYKHPEVKGHYSNYPR